MRAWFKCDGRRHHVMVRTSLWSLYFSPSLLSLQTHTHTLTEWECSFRLNQCHACHISCKKRPSVLWFLTTPPRIVSSSALLVLALFFFLFFHLYPYFTVSVHSWLRSGFQAVPVRFQIKSNPAESCLRKWHSVHFFLIIFYTTTEVMLMDRLCGG